MPLTECGPRHPALARPYRHAVRGGIEAYGNLQSELAKLVSDVNGRHGEVDWDPTMLNKGFGQNVLAGLYSHSTSGVVTPLHDGMN